MNIATVLILLPVLILAGIATFATIEKAINVITKPERDETLRLALVEKYGTVSADRRIY